MKNVFKHGDEIADGAKNVVKHGDEVAEQVVKHGDEVVDNFINKSKTGTVWDKIKSTQPNIPNTNIPKSFQITTPNGKFRVNPNATKHMAEYSTRTLTHGQKLTEQQLLNNFEAAINKATQIGYTFEKPIIVGNWELIFSQAREVGQLPVIKHARYIP